MLKSFTTELDNKESPVRRFLDERFTSGLRDAQRRYRQAAPPLVVPSADRSEANPGTVGTATDWLLRFMLHPRPSLQFAAVGAALCGRRSGMIEVLVEIAESLGYQPAAALPAAGVTDSTDFTGPIDGNHTHPEQLARACWALALLTEMFRNPVVAKLGPLERFQSRRPSADDLLGLASPAALAQLARFREVFAAALLPQLASRPGRRVLGAEFAGSALMKSDADVIAAGLLLDLKTTSKPSLGVTTMFQVIGYALLDFDDAYQLTEVGIFSARYGHLATWDLGSLLDELSGQHVSLRSARDDFRQLLLAHRLPRRLRHRGGRVLAAMRLGSQAHGEHSQPKADRPLSTRRISRSPYSLPGPQGLPGQPVRHRPVLAGDHGPCRQRLWPP
jgi:hypothetical protein